MSVRMCMHVHAHVNTKRRWLSMAANHNSAAAEAASFYICALSASDWFDEEVQ